MVSVCLPAAVAAAVVAPPAQASFPGSNGLIAYSTAADASAERARIHIMTAAGRRRARLTTSGSSRNPAWSRDGERIAFDRTEDGGPRALFVMNPDGSGARRVPTGGRQAYNPAWSPTGRRLVFQGCRGTSECQQTALFVVGVDGSGLRRIPGDGADPVWSPNGKWIAYYGRLAAEDECSTLLRVRPSGGGRRAVLPRTRDSHDTCSSGGSGADFSPDGRRIVHYGLEPAGYQDFPNPVGGTFRVWKYDPAMYTVPVDGGARKLVARRSLEDTEYFLLPFVWSPDGRRLLWRDDRGTFVGNPDGSRARRIGGFGGEFAWQPG
jgi:TolB protein